MLIYQSLYIICGCIIRIHINIRLIMQGAQLSQYIVSGNLLSYPMNSTLAENYLMEYNHLKTTYFIEDIKIDLKLSSNIQSDKQNIRSTISSYIQKLIEEFVPFSYLLLKKSEHQKQKESESVQISIKQFFCLNMCLNLFLLMTRIPVLLEKDPRIRIPKKQLKKWLTLTIQQCLEKSIIKIKQSFPQTTQDSTKLEEQAAQMKPSIKKIDRRQNEEYDYLFLHNLTLQSAPQDYLLSIINQLVAQKTQVEQEIKAIFHIILQDQEELGDESLQTLIQKRKKQPQILKRKIRKIQSRSAKFSNLQQIKDQIFTSKNKNKNIAQKSQLLRILTKFIQNTLIFIKHPNQSTLNRVYPYKNCENMLVYPTEQINLKLYKNVKQIKTDSLKELKKKFLEIQIQLIQSGMCEGGQKVSYINKILNISEKFSQNLYDKCVQFCLQLIGLLKKAGEIQINGVKQSINLIVFNVIDLKRARKSVSVQQYKKIMEKIYDLENPRKITDLSKRQRNFRILRIKDKSSSSSKAVFVNFVYKNEICEIQINTKKESSGNLYQISHLLYELMRGQFGILSQMQTIIASKYEHKFHSSNMIKYVKQYKKEDSQSYQTAKEFIKKIQSNQSQQIKKKEDWTNVLDNISTPQSFNNTERLELIIFPQKADCFKNLKLEEKNFVKYLAVNAEKIPNRQREYILDQIDGFLCVERLVLNHFKKSQYQSLMKDITFINHYASFHLRQLNLSNNNLKNFQQFCITNKFKSLEILKLYSNKFEKIINFDSACFPKLKIVDFSYNNAERIRIFRTRGFNNQHQKIQTTQSYKNLKSKQNENKLKSQKRNSQIQIQTNNQTLEIQLFDIFQNCKFKMIIDESIQSPNIDNFLEFHEEKGCKSTRRKFSSLFIKKFQNDSTKTIPQSRSRKQKAIQTGLHLPLPTSQYIADFKNKMQKMTGILRISASLQQDSDYGFCSCLQIGMSFIVIACAHAIISNVQRMKWHDPQTHEQIKQKILRRTKYYTYEQLKKQKEKRIPLQFQQVWIPTQYITHKLDKSDICILFLKKIHHPENLSLQKIFKILIRQNKQITYNFLLHGYVFGFEQSKTMTNVLLCNFTSIMYNNIRNQGALIKSQNNIFLQSSGSPVVFVKKTSPKDYYFQFIGIKNSFLTNNQTGASIFTEEFFTLYKHMIYSFTQKDTDVRSFFHTQQEFKKIVVNIKTVDTILSKPQNILPFISKFLKCIIGLLERYLFLFNDNFSQNENNQLLKMIYIYNTLVIDEDQYQIDIRNIDLKSIFYQNNSKQKQFHFQFFEFQESSRKLISRILNRIKQYSEQRQVNLIIQIFINYMQKHIKPQGQISLKNVLHVIVWSIDLMKYKQIKEYLYKETTLQMLKDRDYFDIKKIITKLNVFERIDCFAEQILRIKYQSHDTATMGTSINQNTSELKMFQKIQLLYYIDFQQMNNNYLTSARRLKELCPLSLSQPQTTSCSISSSMKKIYLIQTLKEYYPQVNKLDLWKLCKKQKQKDINSYHPINQILQINLKSTIINQNIVQKFKNLVNFKLTEKYILSEKTSKKIIKMINTSIQQQFQIMEHLYQHSFLKQLEKQRQYIAQKLDKAPQKIQNTQVEQLPPPLRVYTSNIPGSRLLIIDQNQQIYMNYVGVITIFDDPSSSKLDQWSNGFCGTGTLIDKNIVITAAHIIRPLIEDKFPKGRFRFIRFHKTSSLFKLREEAANIIEVRIFPRSDIALLVLDQQMVKQCKFKLISHNESHLLSNFESKQYFCRLYGFRKGRRIEGLVKSEGFLFVQNIYQREFKYSISTAKGLSGGVIVFFPTGQLSEPYIFGIHTHGYDNDSEFVGVNNELYSLPKYNYGQIVFYQELYNSKKLIFLMEGAQPSKEQLPISSVRQNSYIFSQGLQQINRWKLAYQMALSVYQQEKNLSHIYWQGYQIVSNCLQLGLVFTDIDPYNLFSFNKSRQFHPFFNVQIKYSNRFQEQNGKRAKMAYQLAINQYKWHLEAAKIVEFYQSLLLQMKTKDNNNYIKIYRNFLEMINQQIIKLNKTLEKSYIDDSLLSLLKKFSLEEDKIQKKSCQIYTSLKNVITIICGLLNDDKFRTQDAKRLNFVISNCQLNDDKQGKQQYDQIQFDLDKFDQIQQKYFCQELIFMKNLKDNKNSKKMILLGTRYIHFKIASQLTYQLYLFCYKHRIKMDQSRQFVHFKKTYVLNERDYLFFKIFREQVDPVVCSQIKNDIAVRARAIFEIQKIAKLDIKQRNNLIRSALNWKGYQQKWRNNLRQRYFNPKYNYLDDDELENLLVLIFNQYNFCLQQEQETHFINLGKIVLEELSFHKRLINKYSLANLYLQKIIQK